jgi:hypothetical protein
MVIGSQRPCGRAAAGCISWRHVSLALRSRRRIAAADEWKPTTMSLQSMRLSAGFVVCAVLLVGCNEQPLQPFERDNIAPTLIILKTQGDTIPVADGIQFAVEVGDNLGIKNISVVLTAGLDSTIDTTFTSAVTAFTFNTNISLPVGTTVGGIIYIDATVIDGNNNATSAQDSIFVNNADALIVTIINPSPGAITSPGRKIPVTIKASQKSGISKVGYTVTGVVTFADSMLFPLPDTAMFDTTLSVPAGAPEGIFTIVGFAEDSSGNIGNSLAIDVTVQTVESDTEAPVVTFKVGPRVEVDDSITVTATDPSGITKLGWLATDATTGVIVGGDSTNFDGTLTQVSSTYNLNFSFTEFPQAVAVSAFAVDAAGNRGEAQDTASTTAAAAFSVPTLASVGSLPNNQGTNTVVSRVPQPLAWIRRGDVNP